MPTNVSVEYAIAEKNYQQASTPQEQLKCLQEMLRTAPTHKGGETLRAEIKGKIAKLKEKLEKEAQRKKGGFTLSVKKEEAAQVVLVGPPNTGKSSILNVLTKAQSPVGNYPFTTTKPELGVMEYETVRIQIVDMPPLVEDASIKQGPLFSVIRNGDLVILVLDNLSQLEPLAREFTDTNILLNKERPPIKIRREASGGITIIGEKLVQNNPEEIRKVFQDYGINNAVVEVFAPVTLDDFFVVIEEKIAFLPAFVVLNKQDNFHEMSKTSRESDFEIIPFSAKTKTNLDLLKDRIWYYLGLVRVYTKEPGKPATKENPITIKKGSAIKDIAEYIHKDFLKKFRYARIWGSSVRHQGQVVGLGHRLGDKDIVEIHLK